MGTVNRTIETDNDKAMASKLIEGRSVPFTLSLTDGKHSSTKQNKTQFMWFKEISEQKGDTTAQEVRAYCKLVIGVPILREQNEAFRIRYDEVLKPLSYEMKLSIMGEPFNLPVTSLMSTKQMSEYMDAIFRHFSSQGIVLTIPDDPSFNSGAPSTPDTADGPTSAEAGDPSPSLPASTPSEWLPTVARMLWAATHTTGDVDANLELLNNQRIACAALPGEPTEAEKLKAGSIYRLCKEVVLSNVYPPEALEAIANHAGCDEREIRIGADA